MGLTSLSKQDAPDDFWVPETLLCALVWAVRGRPC